MNKDVLFLHSFLRLQGKSIRIPSSLPPYDNMTEESTFDNPLYESGVSTGAVNMQDVDSQNTSVLSWSSHLDAIVSSHCSPAEGTTSFIPALTISKRWCSILVMLFIITLTKKFPHLSMWFDVISYSWIFQLSPCWKEKTACLTGSHQHCGNVWFFSANSDLLFIYVDISPLTNLHVVFQDKWKGFQGVNLET